MSAPDRYGHSPLRCRSDQGSAVDCVVPPVRVLRSGVVNENRSAAHGVRSELEATTRSVGRIEVVTWKWVVETVLSGVGLALRVVPERPERGRRVPKNVERRWRERYLPAQRLYDSTVSPVETADIVVHNDEPQQPVWEIRPR